MLRKTGLSSVLALAALATPLHAEIHYVVMLDTGYFPDVVYTVPGDQVRFVNEGELAMAATAVDGSWTTGALAPGQAHVLDIVDGLQASYDNTVPGEPTTTTTTTTEEPLPVVGVIDYMNPAPVDLGADGKPLILTDAEYDN